MQTLLNEIIRTITLLCLYVFFLSIVACSSLDTPTNGMIDCTLGDENTANPGESCTFLCDTGFVLRGSDIRTCQNDRSWNGSETTCVRGMLYFVLSCMVNKKIYTLCSGQDYFSASSI